MLFVVQMIIIITTIILIIIVVNAIMIIFVKPESNSHIAEPKLGELLLKGFGDDNITK